MAFDTPVRAGSNPASATDTVLFTSTDNTSALVTVVNMSTGTMTYRVAHTRGSTSVDDTMYKSFDFELLGNEDRTIGPLFLANADSVVVQADSTNASFTLEGLSTS